MKLVAVTEVPKKRGGFRRLQKLIDEFVKSEHTAVKVEYDSNDYGSPTICYSCMCVAVKRSKHPVYVTKRGDEVYLVKV